MQEQQLRAAEIQALASAQQKLRACLASLRELASTSDASLEEYSGAVLKAVVPALAALAGSVWLQNEAGAARIVALAGGGKEYASQAFSRQPVIAKVIEENAPRVITADELERFQVDPRTENGTGEGSDSNGHGDGGNPSSLLLAPLRDGDACLGVVEVMQRPNVSSASLSGHLRFLEQACAIASEFFTRRRLRQYQGLEQAWQSVDDFCQRAHASLDSVQAAFVVANEGKRIAECGRINVALVRRNRMRLIAASGQDQVDDRANAVKAIEELAEVACAAREPIWIDGGTADLAPQIEDAADAVFETTSARRLGVIPLLASATAGHTDQDDDDPARHKLIRRQNQDFAGGRHLLGALIVEEYSTARPVDELQNRTELIARHAEVALSNCWEHERLFGLPLWRALGKSKAVTSARNLPKTITILGIITAIFLALALIPADFALEGRGVVQPLMRGSAFARVGGNVVEVFVDHGDPVTREQAMARIHNPDLAIEIDAAEGDLATLSNRHQTLRRQRDSHDVTELELRRIQGDLMSVEQQISSKNAQLQQLQEKAAQLIVRSPIDGEVVSWDVQNQLMGRPVERGALLFEVANTNSGWELEVRMPEDRMAHIVAAQDELREDLLVTFIMANDPGESYQGRLKEIEHRAESDTQEGTYVMIRVAFDDGQIPNIRPGAEVIAKVHCGRRSLSRVWLGDAWEWFESRVLFRF